jgi:hypothetical protein
MRKLSIRILLLGLILILIGYSAVMHISARGSNRLLDAMRSIRHGDTREEVRRKMGREAQVAEAPRLPQWLRDVVTEKEKGEYWYYFMGYPPRNLIIYFDEHDKVAFLTWEPT